MIKKGKARLWGWWKNLLQGSTTEKRPWLKLQSKSTSNFQTSHHSKSSAVIYLLPVINYILGDCNIWDWWAVFTFFIYFSYHHLAVILVIASPPKAWTRTIQSLNVCKHCTSSEQFWQLRYNYKVNMNYTPLKAEREISRDDKASGKKKWRKKNLYRELWIRDYFLLSLIFLIQTFDFRSKSPLGG